MPPKRAGQDQARRGTTSYDVARLAGVSQSAVSRAYRPGASVAPETRARIEAAARQLGYSPNAMAQGLITRRSNLIAVIITNLTNLYYPEVLAELSQRLSARDQRVLLFALSHESEVDDVLEQLWRYRVDGAIVAARLHAEQLRQFEMRGVPLVLYNRVGDGVPVASVCCDSGVGEQQLVDALVAAGHRRFGVIGGPTDSYVGEERVNATMARLRHHGIEPRLTRGSFDYASGSAGLAVLLAEGPLDALVCANDPMGIGAVDAARARGIDVPGDLSIVGFDGIGPATWDAYRLTTVRQPVRRMAEAAVQMLMERIEDPAVAPERRLFVGELLPGASARLGQGR